MSDFDDESCLGWIEADSVAYHVYWCRMTDWLDGHKDHLIFTAVVGPLTHSEEQLRAALTRVFVKEYSHILEQFDYNGDELGRYVEYSRKLVVQSVKYNKYRQVRYNTEDGFEVPISNTSTLL